ncbi:MAG: hypothetical protein ACRCT4_11165 [Silvania sp.]
MQIFYGQRFEFLTGVIAQKKSEKQKEYGNTQAGKQRKLSAQACTAKKIDHKLLIAKKVSLFNGRAGITFIGFM